MMLDRLAPSAHGPLPADQRDDRARAFTRAFRHSRRVRRLRVAVPVVATLAFGALVFAHWFDPLRHLGLPISIGALSINGSTVTMELPRLTGYTTDNRFYRVAATRAQHDITRPNLIGLSAIDAEMELAGGATARILSSAGTLDTQTNLVVLTERITVSTSDGQRASASHVVIDTRAGTIVSNQPVELVSPRGNLAADRMNISENGRVIVLEGRVRGDFTPEPPDPNARFEPDTRPPVPPVPAP